MPEFEGEILRRIIKFNSHVFKKISKPVNPMPKSAGEILFKI